MALNNKPHYRSGCTWQTRTHHASSALTDRHRLPNALLCHTSKTVPGYHANVNSTIIASHNYPNPPSQSRSPSATSTPTCSNLHSPRLQSSRNTLPQATSINRLPNPNSLPLLPPSSTMPGHSRSDTALIYGLSTTEVEKLAEACVDAKSKAYCTSPFVCGATNPVGWHSLYMITTFKHPQPYN